MINLMPKEKQSQLQTNSPVKMIGVFTLISIMIFSVCFYLGYLCYKISLNKNRLEQLNLEMKCYTTSYSKVRYFETMLERIKDKNSLKNKVYAGYLTPLNALNSLIQLKPDLIWFDRIQFNGMDGSFSINGGANNYKNLAAFIGRLEQDEFSFRELKPEQITMHRNSAGREYVQFKISGILIRKGEKSVENY
jgi:hypothetical protein